MANETTVATVGARLYSMLLVTTRRADLAQSQAIGSDHLLASMLIAVPRPLMVMFDPPGPDLTAAMSRRLSGGPRLVGTASTEAGWESLGALREAHWNAAVKWRRPRRIAHRATPGWEREVQDAVERALGHAFRAGRRWAGEADLFAGLLDDPGNRAADFLRENGVDPESARSLIHQVLPGGNPARRTPMADLLAKMGVLSGGTSPVDVVPASRIGRVAARMPPLLAEASPILAELEEQTIVQAIRLEQRSVTTAHLVLAVLAFEQELRVTGMRPVAAAATASAPVLFELGAVYPPAPGIAAGIDAHGEPAPPRKKRALRDRPNQTQWTVSAARAADRAREAGGRRGAGSGSLHLLRAALTETDDAGRRLLDGLGLDPERVLAAVGMRLGEK